MKRSFSTILLQTLLVIQGIAAMPAGFLLITDPSGRELGFTDKMLVNSPFSDFLIPGLFLFFILGVLPLILVYALIRKPEFLSGNILNIYKYYHWSLTFAYYFGVLLVLWVVLQLVFIQTYSFLQTIAAIFGLLIIVLSQLPGTKQDYLLNRPEKEFRLE